MASGVTAPKFLRRMEVSSPRARRPRGIAEQSLCPWQRRLREGGARGRALSGAIPGAGATMGRQTLQEEINGDGQEQGL